MRDLKQALSKLKVIANRSTNERDKDLSSYLKLIGECDDCSSKKLYNRSYFIPFQTPEIIAQGTNQLVFSLTDSLVGKTKFKKIKGFGQYILNTLSYFMAFEQQVGILKELGIPVSQMQSIYAYRGNSEIILDLEVRWDPNEMKSGIGFIITPDLRENGRYDVVECNENELNKITNSDEISAQFRDYVKLLTSIYNDIHSNYQLRLEDHIDRYSFKNPAPAIERIFFIKVDENKKGILEAGDIVNILLMEKSKTAFV